MADKFIIEGAAFNGDGTSSAEATVAGGVGAWNTITYFEGATPAYGSIAAGDTVYIRSKTAAGADITRVQAAGINLGSASATAQLFITWILDNGVVWPGVDGSLVYQNTTYVLHVRSYNIVRALRKGAISQLHTANDAWNVTLFSIGGAAEADGFSLDWSSINGGHGGQMVMGNLSICKNLTIKAGFYYQRLILCGNYESVRIINPSIELTKAAETEPVFTGGQYGSSIEVVGGRIFGVGASEACSVFGMSPPFTGTLIGTSVPAIMPLTNALPTQPGFWVSAIGIDGGVGSAKVASWGSMSSRDDGNFPTLNAYLPNSTLTPWSWKIYPSNANAGDPANTKSVLMFSEDAKTVEVTVEALISTEFSNLSSSLFWIDVIYTDDTSGLPVCVSSRGTSEALAVSSAPWSFSSYGPISLLKRKLSVTTPTAVKKDSVLIVSTYCAAKSPNINGVLFVCPEPGIL